MNVFYVNNGFKAGGRFESYAPRINGYPAVFSGTGLGMRYIGYTNALVDVTVGVLVDVTVGVFVGVWVLVGVCVLVLVGVLVGVLVEVWVLVGVCVLV